MDKNLCYSLYIPEYLRIELYNYFNPKYEVCGVLVGRKINSNDWIITNIIYDDKPHIQSNFEVVRNTENLYPKVNTEYLKSQKKNDYIGDWHSHPFSVSACKYSWKDCNTMKRMLRDRDYFFLDEIILLIVCPPDKIKPFLFIRKKKLPVKMKICNIEELKDIEL